jgi:hypothetical protein
VRNEYQTKQKSIVSGPLLGPMVLLVLWLVFETEQWMCLVVRLVLETEHWMD